MKRSASPPGTAVPDKIPHSDNEDGWIINNIRESLPDPSNNSRKLVKTYRLTPTSADEHRPNFDVQAAYANLSPRIRRYVLSFSQSLSTPAVPIKYYIALTLVLKKVVIVDEEEVTRTATPTFRGSTSVHYPPDTKQFMIQSINSQAAEIDSSLSNFTEEGSSWTIENVLYVDVNLVAFHPLFDRGGNRSTYIDLPQKLKNRKALINIKNETDEKCFLWCVLTHFYPVNAAHYRVKPLEEFLRRNPNCVKTTSLVFPVTVRNIDLFENDNPHISINVFAYAEDDDEVIPHRISRQRGREHVINILIYSNGERSHYAYINTRQNHNGLSRLLRKQTGNARACYYCCYCLRRFYCIHPTRAKELCDEHMKTCTDVGEQVVRYPVTEEEKLLKFKDHAKTLRCPYVIYADIECALLPIAGPRPNVDLNASIIVEESLHVPCSYAFAVLNSEGSMHEPLTLYRAENTDVDVIENMINALVKTCERLSRDIKSRRRKVLWIAGQKRSHDLATVCWMCGNAFVTNNHNMRKVAHHDHFTGEYIGAAHDKCNRMCKKSDNIPIVFHNFSGYDSHFIIQSLYKVFDNHTFNVIAENSERIISLTLKSCKMTFIDSFRFMPASLDKLVSDLKRDQEHSPDINFKITKQVFDNEYKMFLRKGIFCYEHVDSLCKLNETNLPPKECFFSKLNNLEVSDDDYAFAKTVWDKFNVANLGGYLDIYLKSDICLLADVFQKFRNALYTNFRLEALHYVSLPSFAWSAMLKMSGVNIELISDCDQYKLFDSMKRGGMVNVPCRFAKAENKYTRSSVQPIEPAQHANQVGDANLDDSFVAYYDIVNSYGASLSEPLPLSDFRWLSESEMESINLLDIADDAEVGYIIQCDFDYPRELHDSHNCLPLAPHRIKLTKNILSPFIQDNHQHTPSVKLMNTLYPKKNYAVHYRTYKFYVKHGLKVEKIHRILSFKQAPYIKPFIQLNTELRNKADSKFKKDICKRTINSTYGRSIMNKLKRVTYKLATNPTSLNKIIASNFIKHWSIVNEHTVATVSKQRTVYLNTPIFIGATVLELSKLLLYQFHYEYIKPKYCTGGVDGCQLLYMDTDSLIYRLKTLDLFDDINEGSQLIDRSNFPAGHKCYNPGPSRIGLMKLETGADIVEEYVGLKPKMYSLVGPNVNIRRAKGVNRRVVGGTDHQTYHKVLIENLTTYAEFLGFQSKHHTVKTIFTKKKFLSPVDDKRFILNDGKTTLAYGHFKAIDIQRQYGNSSPHPSFQSDSNVSFRERQDTNTAEVADSSPPADNDAAGEEDVVEDVEEYASAAGRFTGAPDSEDDAFDSDDDSILAAVLESVEATPSSVGVFQPPTSTSTMAGCIANSSTAAGGVAASSMAGSGGRVSSSVAGGSSSTAVRAVSSSMGRGSSLDSIPSTSHFDSQDDAYILNAQYVRELETASPDLIEDSQVVSPLSSSIGDVNKSLEQTNDGSLDMFDELFHSTPTNNQQYFNAEEDGYILNAEQPPHLSANPEQSTHLSADEKEESFKIPPSLLMESIEEIAPQDISFDSSQFASIVDFLNKK
jgi:hypothetical protein